MCMLLRTPQGFQGVDYSTKGDRGAGPVQFEKDPAEADPFGLDQIISEVLLPAPSSRRRCPTFLTPVWLASFSYALGHCPNVMHVGVARMQQLTCERAWPSSRSHACSCGMVGLCWD
jgi:hypothetical protein